MERIGKTIIKFLYNYLENNCGFCFVKKGMGFAWQPYQINQSYTEFISTHLKRGYPAGKEFLGTLVKTAAKYKTVLVDNQLTLFTTAKTSSNWHYPIRLTQIVYALWLQNFLQGLLMCDRFWFLHILSYSNPIKSQLKTVLDFWLVTVCMKEFELILGVEMTTLETRLLVVDDNE